MLVSTPLTGLANSTEAVAPSVTCIGLVLGLNVKLGIEVEKQGFVIVMSKPIVPLAAKLLEPAGPLLAIVISLARVNE